MGILQRIKNNFSWTHETEKNNWMPINVSTGEGWTTQFSDAQELTYYVCMKILTEAVGKLSLHLKDKENNKVYDHDAVQLLRTRPNQMMSPATLKSLMEYNRNHYGNAYAYIEHDRQGKTVGIHPLSSMKMKIIVDNDGSFQNTKYIYQYTDGAKVYNFLKDDILHLKGGLSSNGLVGKSVREELALTIDGAKESQKYLNNLYRKGLTANAILQYTGDLNDEKKKIMLKKIADFTRSEDTGNIVPIPLGMDLRPLDIKLTDAQFFELKKFTALQIASAFGVKPNHLNNYDKSSYANSEMQNLTFYIGTLLYILTLWEEELNYKLLSEDERRKGLKFEFNVATILRGDIKTQAEALSKFVTGSIYTVNEARSYLGMPKIEDGDKILVNGTYTELYRIGEAYEKGVSE